ncbi:glycoside hydrolase family 28 protein [Roseimaritima ulvae]|uniref:Exo-poly-alpha-D-galacturonosidase n=1 Tax=Roseimaritima ulvae TaxID=980254 RepID=A0A5B9QWX8_9BACT|nr:glycoside hydrolase family 28 protein [Roseimaritima ulvae]QEG43554.1 Exo-poly-alpha-D-galacturonosidase precursor [Roseimaritima ulvae]
MKRRCLVALWAVLVVVSTGTLVQAQADKSNIFNIKTYGAVGDGVTLNTEALQKTIDACHAAGGGTVWVPAGEFVIGTIHLKSHVTLSLDYGASLLGSLDWNDYPTDSLRNAREGQEECLLYAEDATDIRIEGLGLIDGRGTPETFPKRRPGVRGDRRPRLLRFESCKNLTFSGLTYTRTGFWGLHLVDCKQIQFNAVTIRFLNQGPNNDGIDLDGCEDVLIENCDIQSGDDAICLKSSLNPCRNIVVRNCRVCSHTAPLKFGSSGHGGFIDVSVTNCYFYDSPMGAIKLTLVDGGRLENIEISRLVMENVGCPIFIRLANRGSTFGKGGQATMGSLKNIRIRDVVAKVTLQDRDQSGDYSNTEKAKAGPIMISGIPGHPVEDISLENVKISFAAYGSEEDAKRVVPEDENRYPEQFFFGVLPAWGAYIRHAKNVAFKNVELTLRGEDARQEIILDDVEGFVNH